jgi:hypothetical protein
MITLHKGFLFLTVFSFHFSPAHSSMAENQTSMYSNSKMGYKSLKGRPVPRINQSHTSNMFSTF